MQRYDQNGNKDDSGKFVLTPLKLTPEQSAKDLLGEDIYNLTPEQFSEMIAAYAKSDLVKPSEVETIQRLVNPDKVAEYSDFEPRPGQEALVFLIDGRKVLMDGNHRMAAAAESDFPLSALVVDLAEVDLSSVAKMRKRETIDYKFVWQRLHNLEDQGAHKNVAKTFLQVLKSISKDGRAGRDGDGDGLLNEAGDSAAGTPRSIGQSLTSKNPKEFVSKIDEAYSAQGISDWQVDKYSPEAMDARQYFGNEQSFRINQALREGKIPDSRVKDGMKRFATAFERSSIEVPDGTTLYRAVGGDFAEKLASMPEGSSFKELGYFSTAGTKAATKNFGEVLLVVKPAKGLKAMVYKDETEVLFAPGRTIKLGKTKTSGGKRIIEVEMS